MAQFIKEKKKLNATLNQIEAMMQDVSFCKTLKFSFKEKSCSQEKRQFVFNHGVSFTSWGESIAITAVRIEDGVEVEVFSQALMPTQIIDFGKNKKNVKLVFDYITNNLAKYTDDLCNEILMKKQCVSCGKDLKKDDNFCPICGSKQ